MNTSKEREKDLIKQIEYEKWKSTLIRQYENLKNAPFDEYFPRILDIASQMIRH
jgi:hypothetical protein